MKRGIALGLVVIALIICSLNGVAESTKYEITFSGMDWFITPDEFLQNIASKGIEYEISESEYSGQIRLSYWDAFCGYTYPDLYIQVPQLRIVLRDPDHIESGNESICKVAGYDVRNLCADFLPQYDVGHATIGPEDTSRLFRAEYQIDNYTLSGIEQTAREAYSDLSSKLTSLYGEPVVKDQYYSPSIATEITTITTSWLAKDGTAVAIELYTIDGTTISHITIQYAYADDHEDVSILSTLNLVREELDKKAAREAAGTDGL